MFRKENSDVEKLLSSIDFSADSKRLVKERILGVAKNELETVDLDSIAGGHNPRTIDQIAFEIKSHKEKCKK